jgi:two-component system chemotaxis response regulator CheB
MIRILVVEDSLTIRKYLVEVLALDPSIEVVGEAENGKQAIELTRQLRPDVITMDMMLPVMSGLSATEYIMAYHPTPILVVSASVNRGEVFRTYEALAAGAVDVLDKPKEADRGASWEQRFISTVKLISRIKVITHPRGRLRENYTPRNIAAQSELLASGESDFRVIALGASTGGPAAVADILRSLPNGFPVPMLVVIHIAEMFAFALADWLSTQSRIPVRYAKDGEAMPAMGISQVLLAPAGSHLRVRDGHLHLTDDAPRYSCRPSVDVLFESIAAEFGQRACLCLLTGMGRDGASGLLSARSAGAVTIAQDEKSSVVYGMPGEAVRLGAAERVVPLDQIAGTIVSITSAADLRSRQ